GAPLDIVFRVGPADGSARTVELRGELAFPSSPSGKRMCGTLQDVTDRESATEELRKLSMAIEQAADQIVITDSLGTIEYVNRAFEKMTGYTRQEAIGANPRILKSGLQAPSFYSDLWDTLTRGDVFRGVFINRRKNGEIYYEEKTVTPIRNPKGEIAKYVATGTDITDRRLAEEEQSRLHDALRAAATEWRITFDSMPSAITVLDADGVIQRVNHAASSLLRARPADVVGHSLERVAAHEPWLTARSLLDAIAERKSIPPVEIRAGSVTWDVSLTTVGAPGGHQVILVIRDVTHTVALQESLRRNERMSAMGALVAGVAHEARNPLFGISATLDAFEKSLRSGVSDHERYMGVLRRELGRLNRLMHELLEYGRPLDLDLADHELAGIVEKALEACELMASARGVLLANAVDRGIRLWCDGPKVEQAVRNLVENAIQHSPAGRSVTVTGIADEKARLAGCEVVDEGSGFEPLDLPQVFEPFFSRRRGGTGLGLAIVERVIEQHGGRAAATNRSGGGACVSILLPVAEAS
ncbi:MAG TPA: PAS domain S-box protein, partial [Thermoanaerobaculia bacterium]